jgi:hypothetical protein
MVLHSPPGRPAIPRPIPQTTTREPDSTYLSKPVVKERIEPSVRPLKSLSLSRVPSLQHLRGAESQNGTDKVPLRRTTCRRSPSCVCNSLSTLAIRADCLMEDIACTLGMRTNSSCWRHDDKAGEGFQHKFFSARRGKSRCAWWCGRVCLASPCA